MIMSGSFLPEPSWLVWHHQAYSGRGAGIVMESISAKIGRTAGLCEAGPRRRRRGGGLRRHDCSALPEISLPQAVEEARCDHHGRASKTPSAKARRGGQTEGAGT